MPTGDDLSSAFLSVVAAYFMVARWVRRQCQRLRRP